MSNSPIEILGVRERRRRWIVDEKQRPPEILLTIP
jgi:hypothetical protein